MIQSIKKIAKISVAMLLSVGMVLGTIEIPQVASPVTAFGATFSDIYGHWSRPYVTKAVNYGFVNGYNDGRFRPDQSITRAEFSKMLNLAIGNNGIAKLSFWDVDPDMWYYTDVSKGVAAGYISGYSSKEFGPDKNITREEAAVMLARIVPSGGKGSTLKGYRDFDTVANWATPAMQRMTAKNYIGGYNDGKLHPKAKLTRGQAAKIIDEILDKEKIVRNNQRVILSGVTLKDTIYANRISIGRDVDKGNVTVAGCTVLGDLNIEGGGVDTDGGITILNSRIASATVNKLGGNVRVYAKGDTTVKRTDVLLDAKLETGVLSHNGDFGKGFEEINLSRAASVKFVGDFPYVSIDGPKVDIDVSGGTVGKLDISPTGVSTKVNIQKSGSIAEVNANAQDTTFTGEGAVVRLNANATGISYETPPLRIITGNGASTEPSKVAKGEKKFTITSTPKDGAENVSKDESIKINFSSQVRLANRRGSASTLTAEQAESVIKIRRERVGGRSVSYKADVSGDAKSVTIKPDEPLRTNTKYYIVISEDDLVDAFNNYNEEYIASFTTGVNKSDVTFSPANGSTSVSLSAMPTITFNRPVVRADSGSDSITPQYLKRSVLTLKKMGSNETGKSSVEFSASIDPSNKIITITPSEHLQEETTYYITINEDSLQYANTKEMVKEIKSQFITISDSITARKVKGVDDDTITATFTALMTGKVYGIIFPKNELRNSNPTAFSIKNHNYVTSVANNSKHYDKVSVKAGEQGTLTFSDLKSNTEYYVYMVLYDVNGTPYSVFGEMGTTAATKMSLRSLKIGVMPKGGKGEPDKYDQVSTSRHNSEYYIGTKEEITLRVNAEADQALSPKYSFTCEGGEGEGTTANATNPGYGLITIPAGTKNPGTIKVKVSSSSDAYAATEYTIKLVRITPEIHALSVGNQAVASAYDTDNQLINRNPDKIRVLGAKNDPITMQVVTKEIENKKALNITVWRKVKATDGYTFVGKTDVGGRIDIGVPIGSAEMANGFYKVEITSQVGSTEVGRGPRTEKVTKYYRLQFIK